MVEFCQNPVAGRHELHAGVRRLEVQLRTDWGGNDLRATHDKTLAFCSFACLAAWAQEKADQHDDVVLQDGDD